MPMKSMRALRLGWCSMTQPSLLDLPETRQKVSRRVRDTSRAQYRLAVESFTGRKANVLRWLGSYYDQWDTHPTAAELWRWEYVLMDKPQGYGIDYTAEVDEWV